MNNNETFVWTDELVKEYAELYRFSSSRASIESFIQYQLGKKKPLFTTTDGKEVFEGDTVWFVNTRCDIFEMKDFKKDSYSGDNSRTFYTEDAANEYALMNKPCLSYNDLKEFGEITFYANQCIPVNIEQLRKIIKQKLCLNK